MDCPCETCLVRVTCRNNVVRKGKSGNYYLIVEFVEKCPYVVEYFGRHPRNNTILHTHSKINKLCEIFNVVGEGKHFYFVWLASTIGIY
jgi:hypothetical protein